MRPRPSRPDRQPFPKPPARTVARFAALMLVLLFLPQLVPSAVAALVAFAMFVGVGVLIAGYGPQLGMRRSAAWLAFIPFFGVYVDVVALWRLASWPERYWEDTVWPSRWGWLARVGAVLGAGFSAVAAMTALEGVGWRERTAEEVARGRLVAEDERVVRHELRGEQVLLVVEGTADDRRAVWAGLLRPEDRLLGRVWVMDAAREVRGSGGGCADGLCLALVTDEVERVEFRFATGAPEEVEPDDGLALAFRTGPFEEVRAYDGDGDRVDLDT